MYERRIENSMIKMMDQLLKLQIMRELKENNTGEKDNLKKQRQSPAFRAPAGSALTSGRKSEALNPKSETIMQNKANFIGAKISANSFTGEVYENKPRPLLGENKAKQSQFQAGGELGKTAILH
jgi:hypothetical protein